MKYKTLPLYYYPTTVTLVDDEEEFLTGLKLALKKDFLCEAFVDPAVALQHIEKHQPLLGEDCELFIGAEDGEFDHASLNIDFSGIYKKAFSKERFNTVSVVIVDYAMPKQDGLEFSKLVKGCSDYTKIIMLTGQAEETLAVSAFNDQVIDAFLKKSDPNLFEKLEETIARLQFQFFVDMSRDIFNKATQAAEGSPLCMTDSVFAEFFMGLLEEKEISEFYLLSNYGDLLLVDSQGKSSVVAVKSKEDMESFYEMAKYAEAPDDVQAGLKSFSKVPYHETESQKSGSIADWSECLHDAEHLKGEKEEYYYSVVQQTGDTFSGIQGIDSVKGK